MSRPMHSIQYLSQCLQDRGSLEQNLELLKKIDKCCQAVDANMNLANLLNDPQNRKSLLSVFSDEELDLGLQLTVNLALQNYSVRSFSIEKTIDDPRKFHFLYRTLGGWRQFESVLLFQVPKGDGTSQVHLLNPKNAKEWRQLKVLPEGTLVSVYLKMIARRIQAQETEALQRYRDVFDTIQNKKLRDVKAAPVVELNSERRKKTPQRRRQRKSEFSDMWKNQPAASEGPSGISKVVVNKMDTFVHAGNANLIISHLKDYKGRVDLYVLRDKKQKVNLDADSIWGAEIRNGETVMFEFFGSEPQEVFIKELAQKVNKYTQMDKLG